MSRARIEELLQQLQQNKLSRRSFIRSAVLLGGSLGATEALAACGQAPGTTQAAPLVVGAVASAAQRGAPSCKAMASSWRWRGRLCRAPTLSAAAGHLLTVRNS